MTFEPMPDMAPPNHLGSVPEEIVEQTQLSPKGSEVNLKKEVVDTASPSKSTNAPDDGSSQGVKSPRDLAPQLSGEACAAEDEVEEPEIHDRIGTYLLESIVLDLYAHQVHPYIHRLVWYMARKMSLHVTMSAVKEAAEQSEALMIVDRNLLKLKEDPEDFVEFLDQKESCEVPAEVSSQALNEARALLARGGWPEASNRNNSKAEVAMWLQQNSLSIAPLTLGAALGLVRYMLLERVIGYSGQVLVPFFESDEHRKEQNAIHGDPTGVLKGERFVRSWDEFHLYMGRLWKEFYPDGVNAAELKSIFRKKFGIELSETSLGHTKLLAMLHDERSQCKVRSEQQNTNKGSGRVLKLVVPAEKVVDVEEDPHSQKGEGCAVGDGALLGELCKSRTSTGRSKPYNKLSDELP